jgi:hypothetical protein
MPYGFFTVEEWKPPRRGAKPAWVAVLHLDADQSLSGALNAIAKRGRAGFYRVIQTQRQVWAEKVDGKLRLRKWHAGSPQALGRTALAFERDEGVWPVAAERQLRARSQRAKKR